MIHSLTKYRETKLYLVIKEGIQLFNTKFFPQIKLHISSLIFF